MTPDFIPAKNFFETRKQPVSLNNTCLFEDSTLLFHSPRHTSAGIFIDKTRMAMEAANLVAAERDVLYISTNTMTKDTSADAERLFIYTPQFDSIDDKRDYADLVFDAIEHAIRTTGIRTFVIDSVTRIAALSFGRNASAAYVMKRLVALQVKCHLTLLVIADDTTKSATRALTALATNEMALLEEKTSPEKTAPAETLADAPSQTQTPASAPSQTTPSPGWYYPTQFAPATPLTRQQRRALERQQTKTRI